MLSDMAEIRDRASVSSAATLLFVATLIIVVDVRLSSLDLVPDVIGGALVVVAARRIYGAISGASGLRTALMALALIALPVTVLETLAPARDILGLLGLSQLIGTIMLARLLADAFTDVEPGLARAWTRCFHLLVWLALVPFVVGVLIGRLTGGGAFESPLAIVLVVVLVVPLVATLNVLWRTAQAPGTADPVAAG